MERAIRESDTVIKSGNWPWMSPTTIALLFESRGMSMIVGSDLKSSYNIL